MASGVPKGWDKDSDKLFIHETGVRIARQTYKGKDGWYLIPVDLDAAVMEFEPTPEGRDKAFEAFGKGVLVTKPKKTKTVTKTQTTKSRLTLRARRRTTTATGAPFTTDGWGGSARTLDLSDHSACRS